MTSNIIGKPMNIMLISIQN